MSAQSTNVDNLSANSAGVSKANLNHTQAMLVDVARQNRIDPALFLAMSDIETGGSFNSHAHNANTGAAGLFQFIPKTAANYGLHGDARYDAKLNAEAGAKLIRDNRMFFRSKTGREASAAETYMLHQQGVAGGLALIQANGSQRMVDVLTRVYGGNRVLARKAVIGNGLSVDASVGQFRQMWDRKVNQLIQKYHEI